MSSPSIIMAAAILAAAAGSARAQEGGGEFLLEQFRPLPSHSTNILNVGKSEVLPHLQPSFGLLVHYESGPLVTASVDDEETVVNELVSDMLTGEIWAGIGFLDVFDIGVTMPVVLSQSGSDLAVLGRPGEVLDGAKAGDIRIVPKARLVHHAAASGFGVALMAPVSLPTGDGSSFTSDGGVRVEPKLILDWRHSVGLLVTVNVGYDLRPRHQTHTYISDDAITWAAGLEAPTGLRPLKLLASAYGEIAFEEERDPADLSKTRGKTRMPAEVMGGLQLRLGDFVAFAGAGMGLTDGIGSPGMRVVGLIGYTPVGEDTDLDGILDKDDRCIDIMEDRDGFEDLDGCPDPDNDNDKVLDEDDRCPEDPEDRDAFLDEDGCPDPDNDDDKILDAQDECVAQAEDMDGYQDRDGCPELDNDNDGVLDTADKCPTEPEKFNGVDDQDGCPDEGDPMVIPTQMPDLSKVLVRFAYNSAKLDEEARADLDAFAELLKANPQVRNLRVVGHADGDGPNAYNMELAKFRAEKVRDYLILKGVGTHFEIESRGKKDPIGNNMDTTGRARNRRVGFEIIEGP